MGRSAHTAYHYRRSALDQVTITRRHHPLEGQAFEILKDGQKDLLVQLRDGSAIRLPRAWTDADGAPFPQPLPATLVTVSSVRELITLLDALRRRP